MKKIDLFDDKLKQKKDLRESSNITETPHEKRGRDDWLDLPPSSKKIKGWGERNKKRKTFHTNKEDKETSR